MGVLNVTPDSFSDGGELYSNDCVDVSKVLFRAEAMVGAGANVLDVGGESTRPGAKKVGAQQEIDRVLPAIEALRDAFDVAVSVDTSNPQLMRASIALGVDLINDVRALSAEGAIEACANTNVAVCIMHMQGSPSTMQDRPSYDNPVAEVFGYLRERKQALTARGIDERDVILDPGFGFGKGLAHNLALMAALPELVEFGSPILVGTSRKSMLGAILDKPVEQRLAGGLALTALAVQSGAKIIRTHDVAETVDVVKVVEAVRAAQ